MKVYIVMRSAKVIGASLTNEGAELLRDTEADLQADTAMKMATYKNGGNGTPKGRDTEQWQAQRLREHNYLRIEQHQLR